ncbi:hypothetical protein CYY_002602 [Polysphondylium violaceum]|uniref:Phox domain-containing protein n=1 Tax=Polysphondylium violaceum TaxID=133409 RepID=A0A8J4PXV2_9MYCE|nr:hypothetical protein CYY_002602 [Polysphondylium violaceum]
MSSTSKEIVDGSSTSSGGSHDKEKSNRSSVTVTKTVIVTNNNLNNDYIVNSSNVSTTTTTTSTTTASKANRNDSSSNNNNSISSSNEKVIKSALITVTETISPKRKPYTVYRIEVELQNETRYPIFRRYSEFLEFDLKLHAAFPLSKITFPPKKTFGKMNNEFITQRKDDLQKFISSILSQTQPDLKSEPLIVEFFSTNTFDLNHISLTNSSTSSSSVARRKSSAPPPMLPSSSFNLLTKSGISTPNSSNRSSGSSFVLEEEHHITRFIISTLPFWAQYLDYHSLLSLTETCNYLFNTISNYSDLWKALYIEQFYILHFSNTTSASSSTSTSLSSSPTSSSSSFVHNHHHNNNNNSNINTNNNGLYCSCQLNLIQKSPSEQFQRSQSLINLDTHELESYLNSNSSRSVSPPISRVNTSSSTSKLPQPTSPQKPKLTSSTSFSLFSSLSNSTNNLKGLPTEFNRTMFLNLLSTHYQIRTSIDSHTNPKYCDCYSLKFRGSIIGIDNYGTTFLKSLNTVMGTSGSSSGNSKISSSNENDQTPLSSSIDSVDNNQSNNNTINHNISNNNNNNNNGRNPIVSHVVTNNRLLCIQTFDCSTFISQERDYYLSLSHFVIITFSLIDKESFEQVTSRWAEKVRNMCPESPVILVGLHRDLRENYSNDESISYLQGLGLSQSLQNCVAYIESPSASDGVGGWRRSLLTEIASHLCSHLKYVFNYESKRNKYEVKISFLSKIFPKYPDDVLYRALTSWEGDTEKSIELLLQGYDSYVPPISISEDGGADATGRGRSKSKSMHIRSQSTTTTSTQPPPPTHTWVSPSSSYGSGNTSWSLRQSWNSELSKMDKEARDNLIEGYFKEDISATKTVNATSSSNGNGNGNGSNSNSNSNNNNNNNNNNKQDNSSNSSPTRYSVRIPEKDITNLLEKLKKSSVDDFIKGFMKKTKSQSQDMMAETILSFLREMKTKIQSSQVFSNYTPIENEDDMTEVPLNEIENYLYQSIYKTVFSTTESLEKDLILSERMSKLVFVEPKHLEISPPHWNYDLWQSAGQELQGLNDICSPSQKLECVLNCCRIILFLLSNSDSPGGADDFLPHLIYVVMHANVPNLYTNFEFISKFCSPQSLKMERYYYLTTFGIAISFIENIDAKQLKIDPEEYHSFMSGKKKINEQNYDPTKAKIRQKLGIDDETVDNFIITSPKKNNNNNSNSNSNGNNEDNVNLFNTNGNSSHSNNNNMVDEDDLNSLLSTTSDSSISVTHSSFGSKASSSLTATDKISTSVQSNNGLFDDIKSAEPLLPTNSGASGSSGGVPPLSSSPFLLFDPDENKSFFSTTKKEQEKSSTLLVGEEQHQESQEKEKQPHPLESPPTSP